MICVGLFERGRRTKNRSPGFDTRFMSTQGSNSMYLGNKSQLSIGSHLVDSINFQIIPFEGTTTPVAPEDQISRSAKAQ